MKNLIVTMALLVAFSTTSCAQKKSDVPQKVKSAFDQKFPNAKKVSWELEDETEWEAEFKMNGKEYSANFSLNGEWKETEYEIKKSKIPANIKAILDQNFTDYDIEGAEIAETASGKSYEFEIEVGEEESEVVIDANGKLTKKKESEDEEGDEENDDDNN